METFDTPILLIIFNRPEKVKILINSLSKIKPSRIYISADGPRKNIFGDEEKCNLAREAAKSIPWPCEIKTNFYQHNIGVAGGMEAAMSWFFSNVEEGIVLEDDCIPNDDCLPFIRSLLIKYRNDPRVMIVCGNNLQDGIQRGHASYYFSNYHTWGYAMWKRTWNVFDAKLNGLDEFIKKRKIDSILEDPVQKKYWISFFKKIRSGKFNFTETRLKFSVWNAGGVCIIPNVNLIKNIGFDNDSTHTFSVDKEKLSLETGELKKIIHPDTMKINYEADDYYFYKKLKNTFFEKLRHKTKMWLK
jgi:hypothetical protein